MDDVLRKIAERLLRCSSAASFDPLSLAPRLWPHLYVLDIERGPKPGAVRLRIRLTGTSLDAFFARRLVGHYLDEFMHGPHASEVLAAFGRCALDRQPVWMRQVVTFRGRAPRLAEGIAVHLDPGFIYGGLLFRELDEAKGAPTFEWAPLDRA